MLQNLMSCLTLLLPTWGTNQVNMIIIGHKLNQATQTFIELTQLVLFHLNEQNELTQCLSMSRLYLCTKPGYRGHVVQF